MAAKEKKSAVPEDHEFVWPFGKKNYLLFGVALLVIIIGYVALGQGSMTLAPFLLVIGYCILIPIALLVKGRRETVENSADKAEAGSD